MSAVTLKTVPVKAKGVDRVGKRVEPLSRVMSALCQKETSRMVSLEFAPRGLNRSGNRNSASGMLEIPRRE